MSMRKSINIISLAVMAVLAMILTAGCINEKESLPSDAKDVMVLLNVSADKMQTKAALRDENAINTIRIFAFDQSGKQIGHVYQDNPAAGDDFHMLLSVSEGLGTMTVDFYAVVNEETMYHGGSHMELSDEMTSSQLENLVYSSLLTSRSDLPMYGVLKSKVLDLAAGNQHTADGHTGFLLNESVNIKLYRSLAKIGVYAAAYTGITTDPQIHSITLRSPGRRNRSYLFPSDNLQGRDATVSSFSSDRVFDLAADGTDVLSNGGVVSARLDASNLNVSAIVTDYYTEILAPFYLAEVPYGSDDWSVAAPAEGRPVVLDIEYSFGAGTVRKYATVNMPQIERNHFYQVRCLIKSDGQVLLNVSVNPWEAGEDWDISFDFPTHNNPVYASDKRTPEGQYVHTYQTPAEMYFSGTAGAPEETGAFSVDFNMSYPIGGRWQPTLSDASNTMYELRLYEQGSDIPVATPITVTNETKDKWYTIKVVPLDSENVGKKATLSISYTNLYVGNDYSYLLQINGGEENNLAWTELNPVAGDAYEASTVDIVITQTDTKN